MKTKILILTLSLLLCSCDKEIPQDPYDYVNSYGFVAEYTENSSLKIESDDKEVYIVENIEALKINIKEGDRVIFSGEKKIIRKENEISIFDFKLKDFATSSSSKVLNKSDLTQQDIDSFDDVLVNYSASLTDKYYDINYSCIKEGDFGFVKCKLVFIVDDTSNDYMKIDEDGELSLNIRMHTITDSDSGIYSSIPVEQYTKIAEVKRLKLRVSSMDMDGSITTKNIIWNK